MFFLTNACEMSSILKVVYFVKQLINVVFLIIPMGLIVMVSIDMAKGVISKEDDLKNNKDFKVTLKRILMCIALFLVPTIVSFVIDMVNDSGNSINYLSCFSNATVSKIDKFVEQENFLAEAEENDRLDKLKKKYEEDKKKDNKTSTKTIVDSDNSSSTTSSNNSSVSDNSTSNSEKTTNASADALINSLDKMSSVVEKAHEKGKSWKYSNDKTSGSFSSAKKSNHKTNCAKYVSWGLVEIGILDSGDAFYKAYTDGKNKIVYNHSDGSVEKKMKNGLKYISKYEGERVDKLIKDGSLKPGDIVLWEDERHTNVYAGGGKWYDAGRWRENGAKGNLSFKTFGPIEIKFINKGDWKRVWKILRVK